MSFNNAVDRVCLDPLFFLFKLNSCSQRKHRECNTIEGARFNAHMVYKK